MALMSKPGLLILETCDKLCVMYSGEAVERGTIANVFDRMRHPYTQALFRSIPLPGADKNARPLVAIPGNFPLPHERPTGCNFGPRCDYYQEGRCDQGEIQMSEITGDNGHVSRCLRTGEIDRDAPLELGGVREKAKPGKVVLKIDHLKNTTRWRPMPCSAVAENGWSKPTKPWPLSAKAGAVNPPSPRC
jgi:peptide/nickel transport system ATP-binding protein